MELQALKRRREDNGEKMTPEEEREQVTISPLEFENLNWREMARYVAVCEKMTSGVEEVRRLLPRRSKEGAKAESITMKNKEINGIETDTEIEWTFPACTPTNEE